MALVEELHKRILGDKFNDFRDYTIKDANKKVRTRDTSILVSPIDTIAFHCTDANGWSPDKLAKFFIWDPQNIKAQILTVLT